VEVKGNCRDIVLWRDRDVVKKVGFEISLVGV